MRKVFQEPKFKKHSLNRAKDELKKRRVEEAKKWKLRTNLLSLPHPLRTGHRAKTVHAPGVLSFHENAEETIEFFSRIEEHIVNGWKLKIDLRSVNILAPDALLYTISLLDYYRQKGQKYHVSGNVPENPVCREMFLQSGFLDYVKSSIANKKSSSTILRIEKHHAVMGSLAKKIVEFCMINLGQTKSHKTRQVARTILELMNNTREHAYPYRNQQQYRYYVMALFERQKNRLTISFVDNGVGISETIKKTKVERIKEILSKDLVKQHELIFSALKGEFRTMTNEGYRGRGLPAVYACFREKDIDNLVILSRKAYLDLANGTMFDMKWELKGTLFSWIFSGATQGA